MRHREVAKSLDGELRTMLQYFASHLSHAVDWFDVPLPSSDPQGVLRGKKGKKG